jgi:acetyl esterase/lipase
MAYDVPTVVFAFGMTSLLLTLLSHRPLRGPTFLVPGVWGATWLRAELPVHVSVVEGGVVGAAALVGGLEAWPGWVGVACAAASAVGMLAHTGRARVCADTLAAALAGATGSAEAGQALIPVVTTRWGRMLGWPGRHPDVERVGDVSYYPSGSRRHTLDIYRRSDARCAPVLLFVHGGAWLFGHKGTQGLLLANHMAQRGWICVSINYRLSPSATFPDHLVDVKRAIAWVRRHIGEYGGDPGFVVLAGGSAGAHLAALAALTPNDVEYQRDFPEIDTRVQGCIGLYGVYDFTHGVQHWPHGGLRHLLRFLVMKRAIADAAEEYMKASPIARIGAHAPPFFLVHGDSDVLVPIEEARRFAEVFRQRATSPVALAELPGACHAFDVVSSLRGSYMVAAVERFCGWLHDQSRTSCGAQVNTEQER